MNIITTFLRLFFTVCLCACASAKAVTAQIAAGPERTMALKGDGTVWTWGGNKVMPSALGPFGVSNAFAPGAPQPVGLSGVAGIATGGNNSVALKSDGTVWVWGDAQSDYPAYNPFGWRYCCANGLTQVAELSGIIAIAQGGYHLLALKADGTVWRWGGNNQATSAITPTMVSGIAGVTAIAAKGDDSIALKSDGTVWTWGQGDAASGFPAPAQVSGLATVAAIAAGGAHKMALKTDGSVWTWGANNWGQLGNGGVGASSDTPVAVTGLTGVVAIDAGAGHSLALKADGSVSAWGYNRDGQLGNGNTTNSSTPVKVAGLNRIKAIAAGSAHSAVLDNDGAIMAWGSNLNGTLGTGVVDSELNDVEAPTVLGALGGVTAVAAGTDHALALKSDGTVWAWGAGYGQSLFYLPGNANRVERVAGLSAVAAIGAGGAKAFALLQDGTVWQWNAAQYPRAPQQVAGLGGIVGIAAGTDHVVALKSDGTLWAWGGNRRGELGNGGITASDTPLPVPGVVDVAAIAVSGSHTVALTRSGTVFAWGYNGDMPNGNFPDFITEASTPALVTGVPMVSAIAARDNDTVMLASGTVWEAISEIGVFDVNGVTTIRGSQGVPAMVANLSDVKSIVAGLDYGWTRIGTIGISVPKQQAGALMALKNDGTVWLSTRTAQGASSAQVAGLGDVTAIAVGAASRYALRRDGALLAWGANRTGALGVETNSYGTKAQPVIGGDGASWFNAQTEAGFSGPRANYTIVRTGSGFTVTDNVGSEGVQSFVNAIRLKFADTWVAMDIDGVAGQVYRLYQAAFDRQPDLPGFGYQIAAIETSGLNTTQLAQNFLNSPEFDGKYGGMTDTQFVTQLYQNILHRAPDAGGLAFYVDGLAANTFSRARVLLGFSAAPENQALVLPAIQNGMQYTPLPTQPIPGNSSVGYIADNAGIFPNPERGFYAGSANCRFDLSTLEGYRKQNMSLALCEVNLAAFLNSNISSAALSDVGDAMALIRQAGLKAIVRFGYSWTDNAIPQDTSKAWILTHIAQLKSLLQSNGDVIAVMQAGFIGIWGEWYSTDYFGNNGVINPQQWQDRKDVLEAILDALPATRSVQVRTPAFKKKFYGDAPLSAAEAFGNTYKARVGHHNDCFVASDNDYGTYVDVVADKAYLATDAQYAPQGGETCGVSPRSGWADASNDMKTLHYSYLNSEYNMQVLSSWGADIDTAKRSLGYRLVLTRGGYSSRAAVGGSLSVNFSVRNDGYAAPYNPRKAELVLRNTDSGALHRFNLDTDPRLWASGATTLVSQDVALSGVPAGSYALLLNLADPLPSLAGRPEYAIRLANSDLWEADTGFNGLNHTVVVAGSRLAP